MSDVFVVKQERYLECLRNHAAALGGHCRDGCTEFVPPVGNSLNCVACGCHRAFHRRVQLVEPVSPPPQLQPMPAAVLPGASTSAVTTNAPSASTARSSAPPGAAPVKGS